MLMEEVGVGQSGSRYERKEAYHTRQRSASPEDRDTFMERKRSPSPQSKGYLEHRRSDREHSGRGHYDDRYPEPRGRERQERERESDWKKHRKSRSPDRKNNMEKSGVQSPLSREEPPPKKKKEEVDPILTRTGGAYIPPAKLRMMQAQITDKNSLAYQRMSWEALKKSINGLINKVNVSNIRNIISELLQENIVRGRGLLARSILQAQSASPIFTHVYAAVVAIINSKFPNIGELILKRLILNFRKGYRRNDKAHEVLCLEMLTLLLERPTDDSIEVSIGFLKDCGLKLTEVSPRGINAIFDRLRHVLHESETDKRVQYMIEVMFAVRKDGFKDHPVIPEGLDLVEEEDQFTHMLPLEDEYNPDDILNVFKMDPEFMDNEEKYKTLKKEILDEGDSDSEADQDAGSSEEEDEEEREEEEEDEEGQKVTIHDKTEINLVSFRRTIYLAIQSSLDFEECAHKLLKMDFPDSQTKELCNMILDCCAQQRTYEKFFGLLAGRFCMLKKEYMESFEAIFKEQYDTIHRLETNKLRNVAKMFAHLLYTDSLPWSVLECISLSEETTTSSSRIFVKIFFQELSEYMGLPNLNARLKDETLLPFFEGLLPRDNPRNTRFAINFFTSIGLGGLTDELREHLKNAPKIIMTQKQDVESSDSSSESDTSDSEEDSSSSESSGSSSGNESNSDNLDSSGSGKVLSSIHQFPLVMSHLFKQAAFFCLKRNADGGHFLGNKRKASDNNSCHEMADMASLDKKKSQKKKNPDKGTQRKQENKKKKLEKEKEGRRLERENSAARNSERNADKSSSRKDETYYDRDYSSDRNNSRSGKERNREKNVLLDSKTGHSKKRKERRSSFSEDEERDRHHRGDSKLQRGKKDRSKSRERPHHYPSPGESEENNQYSNQYKDIRKDESRRRHRNASPSRHK
ncbi:hypothetical protein Chor_015845 [Crotalus horridus]